MYSKRLVFSIFLLLVSFFARSLHSEPYPRGKVGQIPDYPTEYPQKEVTALVLTQEPSVEITGRFLAEIKFKTAMPCPRTKVYYGIYEPDQTPPLPRYRRSSVETLDGLSTEHRLQINLQKLLGKDLDITGLEAKGGGLIAYRIEIFNPASGSSVFYDRRFEFYGNRLFPTVIEGPFVDQITETSAIISWETDQPAHGEVTINNDTYKNDSKKQTTHFELMIDDLKPGQMYPYRIEVFKGEHRTSTREYYFRTPEKDNTSFTFAVMGDSRSGYGGGESAFGGVNYRILNQFVIDAFNRGVDFIVHTGDLVNGHTTSVLDFEMQLEAFKDAVEPVGHYIPIYEVMGNHEVVMDVYDDGSRSGLRFDKQGDVSSEAVFGRAFVNPMNGLEPDVKGAPPYRENVYYFDFGHCRFVVMNNNYWWSQHPEKYGGNLEGYVLDDQYEWLKRVFADAATRSTIEHIFLFAQEPMFPTGGHVKDAMWYNGGGADKNNGIDRRYVVERRDEIWQAFCETGKAVVGNFGDEHNYSRTLITSEINLKFKHPVWQIISGGAGAPFYAQDKDVPWAEWVRAFSTNMNWYLVKVDGSRIEIEVFNRTGQLIDTAVLKE